MENELPNGWKEVKLSDLAEIQSGGTPSRSNPTYWNGNIPWVKISDIKGKYIKETEEFITEEGMANSSAKMFERGTIIFSIFATIGKVAILDINATTNQALVGLKNNNLVDKSFLVYALTELSERISNLGKGVAQKNINISILKAVEIPLPPLEEQKQIAEKLDKLFAQIETIKKSTERIPELLKNFRQQILTYAVTGKLTESYRNNTVDKDLHKVIMQIKESRISDISNKTLKDKLEKIYLDSNSSLDFSIPEQWMHVNLDKICDSFVYGTSSKSENEGKYPVIRMGNIQNGKLDWSDLKYTSDESEYMKYKLNVGDILFNRTNSPELVGKTTVYDGNRAACYAGYIIKIDPYRRYVNPYYLNIVLNSQYAKRWCWENKTDGVSQSNINAQKISKFTIPYPSLSEQEEIVNRVQLLFDILDDIERRYKVLCDKFDKLPQALLCKAFKGKLV